MALVLIVEDDALVRDVADGIVQDSNHRTLLAGDPDEALVLLRGPGTIDVMFTDIRLKEALHGGCDLARQARELRPDIGIIYTTGHFDEGLRSLLLPGAPILLKPYSHAQLTELLTGLLRGLSEP
jgi:CheY-like chemotaxis protein